MIKVDLSYNNIPFVTPLMFPQNKWIPYRLEVLFFLLISISLSIYLSIYLYIYIFIYLSMYIYTICNPLMFPQNKWIPYRLDYLFYYSFYLFIYVSIQLSIYLCSCIPFVNSHTISSKQMDSV